MESTKQSYSTMSACAASWLPPACACVCHHTKAVLHFQVGSPPQCTFEGAEDLIQGCAAELQSLSTSAASKVDVPCSLLLNGLLQRHCFTYASLTSLCNQPDQHWQCVLMPNTVKYMQRMS